MSGGIPTQDHDPDHPNNEDGNPVGNQPLRRRIINLLRTIAKAEWITAFATIGLAIFAYMAWIESRAGTKAMEGQLQAMRDDQRPLIWLVRGDPAPTFNDATGQVSWTYAFGNLGKGVAYNLMIHSYIRLGNEKYQIARGTGPQSKEEQVIPETLPPNAAPPFTTPYSREGVSKEYFNTLMATDRGIGLLMVFDYTDAGGRTKFTTALCAERLITGAVANQDPEKCPKE